LNAMSPGPANKKRKSAPEDLLPKRTSGFRVPETSYPSGHGCYEGEDLTEDYIASCTELTIVGEYDTQSEAVAAAKLARDKNCQLYGWAEELYGDKPPPYESYHGKNFDDDEYFDVDIIDIAKALERKSRELVEARASKTPSAKKPAGKGARKFGPQKGNFKPDLDRFVRNPCLVANAHVGPKLRHAQRLLGSRLSQVLYLLPSECHLEVCGMDPRLQLERSRQRRVHRGYVSLGPGEAQKREVASHGRKLQECRAPWNHLSLCP